jgi:hypothetical protein
VHNGGGGGFSGHDGGLGGGQHGGIGGGHHGGMLGGGQHHHHSAHGAEVGSGQIPQYGVAPIRLQGGPGGIRPASRTSRHPSALAVRYISAAVFVVLLIVAMVLMH